MSRPCARPECGGAIHTDGWGTPIQCPARRCPRCDCPNGAEQCEHCKVCPHADGGPKTPPEPAGVEADPHGLKAGMIVAPYTEYGQRKWVFRCWGTDTCEGLVSLDHHSQGAAERARDRHTAEAHSAPTPLEEAQATVEDLRYRIRRARQALGGDGDAEAAIVRVRALHTDEFGSCSHCTRADAVPYPCPTIRTLDGEAP